MGWFSGQFPERIKQAFLNSSRVISAWDGGRLVGLIRGLDDGIWQATIDCLLVHPAYQGQRIGAALLKRMLHEYQHFLYVTVVPDEKKNVVFYEKYGFQRMEEGIPLQKTGCWQKEDGAN